MYFFNRYCPNSDYKWRIKCPAKQKFCRNSILRCVPDKFVFVGSSKTEESKMH